MHSKVKNIFCMLVGGVMVGIGESLKSTISSAIS